VHGSWVGRRLRERDPIAVVRLRAGGPQCPHRLDADLETVESLGGRREPEPEAEVLALEPAGAHAHERATAGEDIQRCGGLGGDPGRAERDRCAQRAEPQPSVQAGEQAERDPGLGNRLPRRTDLGDLDQVVHQGEPREPGLVRRERDVAQPSGRVLAPREPGDLEHHAEAVAPDLDRDRPRGRRRRLLLLPDHDDLVPALVVEPLDDRPGGPLLVGQYRSGHWPITRVVAVARQRRRDVEGNDDGR
jgi:hypothetical protein